MKTYVEEVNGLAFRLRAEEALCPQVLALLRAFGAVPKEKLRNESKIQIGFSVIILEERDGGYCVTVPDYTKSPFSDTTEDLTIALWIQMEQTDLLRQYGLEGEPVRFDDPIAVSRGALQEERIFLQRFSDLGGSGWCVKPVDGGSGEYEAVYAYELLKIRPELLKVLVLPYEYLAVFEGESLAEILNEKNESILL